MAKFKLKHKKEPKLPSWEEVHELDDDDLEELVNDQDVDFGDKEFDSDEAIRDFVCKKLKIKEEETEEAEEEKPSKKKKGGKKEPELPTHAEVTELGEEADEDGLTALIEEHELDIDPDDYSEWSEVAEKVIEALELEAEEEEEELPSWDEVHELSEKKMAKFIEDNELKVDPDDYAEWDEVADAICEALEIEEEKKASKKKKGSKKEEEELPSWEEVHELDEDDLTTFASEHDVDLDKEFDDLEAAADHICEELEIEAPKKSKLSKLKKKSKK